MANSAILYQAEQDLQKQQNNRGHHTDLQVVGILVVIFLILLFFVA